MLSILFALLMGVLCGLCSTVLGLGCYAFTNLLLRGTYYERNRRNARTFKSNR